MTRITFGCSQISRNSSVGHYTHMIDGLQHSHSAPKIRKPNFAGLLFHRPRLYLRLSLPLSFKTRQLRVIVYRFLDTICLIPSIQHQLDSARRGRVNRLNGQVDRSLSTVRSKGLTGCCGIRVAVQTKCPKKWNFFILSLSKFFQLLKVFG